MATTNKNKRWLIAAMVIAVGILWTVVAAVSGGVSAIEDLFIAMPREILGGLVGSYGAIGLVSMAGFAFIGWLVADVLFRARKELREKERERRERNDE